MGQYARKEFELRNFKTVQFVQGQFVSSYDATIEDSYRKHVVIDGEDCRLEILDTAGTEQFSGLRDLYVRNGQGFILVYSVNDQNSLDELHEIRNMIVRIKKDFNIPMVVVGNKTDLRRVVPESASSDLGKQFGCSFYESSAKLNENVAEVLEHPSRLLWDEETRYILLGCIRPCCSL
ncbi:unnamed protein product [Angiostrongylus costaricensis]|uniref:Small monomeric GTPase n=1 Tax=Angiostrongylus costaricensis TaxID=334426 RepID=A0A0R3PLR6_ANGCS|nr:unnamed protein product [Angiostrongylus costaricensis]